MLLDGNVGFLLFLDAFKVHQCAGVKDKFADIGVNLRIIPGGCTWLVQPIDVGVGKPFKDLCRKFWWEWMMTEKETGQATREQQCGWIKRAWEELPPTAAYNSWRKTSFSFFPEAENAVNTNNWI